MSWPDIEAFLAIAQEGQLARAAERLGASVPTLHRRVAALEDALGTALFVRGNNGHRLTEAGQRLLASAEAAENAIAEFSRAVATVRTMPEGTVRIAAPDMIVLHFLAPRAGALRHAAPSLLPEFITSPGRARLIERQADIAVRLSDPGEDSLFARRIGTVRFGLYAPEEATLHGVQRSADGWLNVPWVGWNDELAGLPAARCVSGLLQSENKASAANTLPQQLTLTRALGAAVVLPDFVARREAGLRPVEAAPSPVLEAPLWLVVNQEVRGSPSAEAVTSWIEESLWELN